MFTWLAVGALLGSPDSFPQEHFTTCPLISVLWTATIAWVADSFVENLNTNNLPNHLRRIVYYYLTKA